MITSLRIKNFVLVDSVVLNFSAGFTVITGETGSGKSILLNALNLILGERADFSVIGSNGDKSIVEAEIDTRGFYLDDFFSKNDIDQFATTIIRREIYKQGRSRAFINDTPVQLNVLKSFSSQLIQIHSQYNTLELRNADFQMHVLDILAGTFDRKQQYAKAYNDFVDLRKDLNRKEEELKQAKAQADYNNFQLDELEKLNLAGIDYEGLRNDLLKSEHAEDVAQGYQRIIDVFNREGGLIDELNQVKSSLVKSTQYDKGLAALLERINTLTIDAVDIVSQAEDDALSIEFNPSQIDEIVVQLDSFNRVLQKHSLNTQQELVELEESLAQLSTNHQLLENTIVELRNQLETNYSDLFKLATILHNERVKATALIEKQLKVELAELKLPNTVLKFRLEQTEQVGEEGISKLSILFSPNIGVQAVPIHSAASGGELSRVMLALQSLMSMKTKLRSMLFDEIDTGVSGDVAQKMGNTLSKMGKEMQVIAITHLPQVAAKGGQHLKVSKSVKNEKTITDVFELTHDEAIQEVARLMSGDEINNAALENAKALMK